jgi:hypothetical protein
MWRALLASSLLTFSIGSAVFTSPTAPQKSEGERIWHAATYRGLTIDKSTRADMIRVLGEPLSAGPSVDQDEPQPIIWNDYGTITGELPGWLAVEVDSRNDIIVGISISPEHMSQEEAIKYFGDDYLKMSYEFCEGIPEDAEAGPVYENPGDGVTDYIEYRSRGIAIHVSRDGRVNAIYFVSSPMGLASKEDCQKELEKFREQSE